MTPQDDPSLNRRKLRLALRDAREGAKLTQRDAATALEWSPSKLIRVETGTVGVSVTDLRALLKLYQVRDPRKVTELEAAARGSKGASWWSSFHDVLNPQFAKYLGYETAATSLRTYHPIVVPGHLHTHQYATALLEARGLEGKRLERLVELRMLRQERMFNGRSRPPARFVLDEAALRRQVGGREVMRGQLDALEAFGARDDVSIRVLPFESGAHYSTLGSFVLLTFEEDDDLLYLEHAAGSMTGGEDMDLLGRYQECFETLMDRSLDENDSLNLIRRIKEDLGVS
ncbi:helix-turn-helix transcriptional regulator [Streptomyces sp. NPDC051976]|uniref:helix-turn-helix domain-containing protein n=1 Tax=Streptomyces sp. NPDC051976 TaxID=3154947 RepID=UPI0034422B13